MTVASRDPASMMDRKTCGQRWVAASRVGDILFGSNRIMDNQKSGKKFWISCSLTDPVFIESLKPIFPMPLCLSWPCPTFAWEKIRRAR